MSKSTEQELSELHGTVARVLKTQLTETIEVTNEDTGEKEVLLTATPAVLSAAIKFLKDNDITASVAEDENLGDLEELLAQKRNKRKLRLVGEE